MAQTDEDAPETDGSVADGAAQNDPTQNTTVSKPQFNKMAMLIVAAIVVTIGGAVAGVFAFVDSERQRDVQAWQVRLGIVADSRSADINAWVDQNFTHMKELAQNASLQLYMSDLDAGPDDEPEPDTQTESSDQSDADLLMGENSSTDEEILAEDESADGEDEEASASYLRNLLIATAERTGFKAPAPVGEIAANIERAGVAGIGLVNADGQALVATPDMPPMTGRIRKAIAAALDGEPTIIDIFSGAAGDPTIGFVLPVYGVQDDGEGAKGIGAVVGLRIIGDDLFSRMKQPGDTSASSETYLVRSKGATVEYLTPLADGTGPLKKSMSSDTPDLAAAFGLSRPGGFGIKVDYAGTEVLAASRQIANLPWVLIRKVSRDEALSATDTRLTTILGVFIGIIVIVTLAILYVWKKGASMRATQALHDAEVALERFGNVSKFMKVVTDNQPNHIIAVDGDTAYTFANGPAADEAGISVEDMMGKTMASVMGPIKAQKYADLNKDVLISLEKAAHTTIFGDESGEDDENPLQVVRSFHVPLKGDRDFPPAVLMILSDIAERL